MSQIPVDQALVSIVLPTYSRAQLLGHAIRSVLGQTYGNLELIVVDDNSNDDTPDVVRSFNDARIRYVRNEANLKLPRALNKGFELARGDFLTWTSDDNLYASNAIEKMVAVLRGETCDFVFADYFLFSDLDMTSGKPSDTQHVKLPPVPRLEKLNTVGACFLYTRAVFEAIGPYDPELFLVEDYDYFMRIQKRFTMRHIAEPLYYFSRHDESLFCSRFAEVQAAGILVRFKNELLDKDEAAEACVGLLMRDLGALKNPFLRSAYLAIKKTPFRLTGVYERVVSAYMRRKIAAKVQMLLEDFSSHAVTFSEARDALRDVLQKVAKIEYK